MAISSLSSLGVLRASREVTGTDGLAKKAKPDIAIKQNTDGFVASKVSDVLRNVYNSQGFYRLKQVDLSPVNGGGSSAFVRPPIAKAPVAKLPADIGPIAYDQPGVRTPLPKEIDAATPILRDRPIIEKETTIDLGDIAYGTDPVPASPTQLNLGSDVVSGKFKPIAQLPSGDDLRGRYKPIGKLPINEVQPIKAPPILSAVQATPGIAEAPISLYPVNELA